jgi:hypothetical protein
VSACQSPTICSATGRPALVKPHGTLAHRRLSSLIRSGTPVQHKIIVRKPWLMSPARLDVVSFYHTIICQVTGKNERLLSFCAPLSLPSEFQS